jgi:pantetheine-phosphate adenylyltransferase
LIVFERQPLKKPFQFQNSVDGSSLPFGIYIAVADSPHKNPLFSLNERKDMIDYEFSSSSSIEVVAFDNLLVEFAKSLNAQVIVRGLRVVSDFEYEFQMVGMNRQLNSEIETVFLMADAQRQSISSNFIRDIARLNGDISNFTTDYVSGKLKQKFNN